MRITSPVSEALVSRFRNGNQVMPELEARGLMVSAMVIYAQAPHHPDLVHTCTSLGFGHDLATTPRFCGRYSVRALLTCIITTSFSSVDSGIHSTRGSPGCRSSSVIVAGSMKRCPQTTP